MFESLVHSPLIKTDTFFQENLYRNNHIPASLTVLPIVHYLDPHFHFLNILVIFTLSKIIFRFGLLPVVKQKFVVFLLCLKYKFCVIKQCDD